MSDYKRLTFEETVTGLHWAKCRSGCWDLVDICVSAGHGKEIYHMGWDCRDDPSQFAFFVKADLVTPDGKPYET